MKEPTGKLKFAYDTITYMEGKMNELKADKEKLQVEVKELKKDIESLHQDNAGEAL